jgi:DNA mismatch repair protein MutS
MAFELDRQTISDLELFASVNGNTIYSFYNSCATFGGRLKLQSMMEKPINDLSLLTERREIISFFVTHNLSSSLKNHELEIVEEYINLNTHFIENNLGSVFKLKIDTLLDTDAYIYKIENGIRSLSNLLHSIRSIIDTLRELNQPKFISSLISLVDNLSKSALKELVVPAPDKKIPAKTIAKFDVIIRKTVKQDVQDLIHCLYELDVYQSISSTAIKHCLCFPEYSTDPGAAVEIIGLYHPGIKKPVSNNVTINANSNVFFMTGGNMSGKSSFLKSLGLAIYLAHIGFPIPAERLKTRVFNGLITMLNLADNINLGYSHYYSEVMRVKESALKVVENQNIFVIYDELFRGTNNKDAYQASLLIIPLLTKLRHSVFFVSSHVLELGDDLNKYPSITFKCFRSNITDGSLSFDFKLQDGISKEQIGMYIIKKSGIAEIMQGGVSTIQ